LLTLTRNLRYFEHAKGCHTWLRGEGYRNVVGIDGLTLGVVGFGNIGRAIAKRGHGFELKVLAVDANEVPGNEHVREVWRLNRLHDLVRQADVLAIAVPITPETRGMIGKEEIRLLKRGSYLIVVSRGGIVDEKALQAALQDGHLAGAGLD